MRELACIATRQKEKEESCRVKGINRTTYKDRYQLIESERSIEGGGGECFECAGSNE